jgi:hypothetical protein
MNTLTEDLDSILGIDRIDLQLIGQFYFEKYIETFADISGYKPSYEGYNNNHFWFTTRNRDVVNLAATSRAFKTLYPNVKYTLYYEYDGGNENPHGFTILYTEILQLVKY